MNKENTPQQFDSQTKNDTFFETLTVPIHNLSLSHRPANKSIDRPDRPTSILINEPVVMDMETKTITNVLLKSYEDFCRNAGLNFLEANNLKKMILANLKLTVQQKKEIYSKIYETNPYIDWEYIQKAHVNSLGDFFTCIIVCTLYIQFPEAEKYFRKEVSQDKLPLLHAILTDTIKAGLPVNIEQNLNMVVLSNLQNLAGFNVLEKYTSKIFSCPTWEKIQMLTSHMADYRFTGEQYAEALGWVLSHMKITDVFVNELQSFAMQKETISKAMEVKHIGTVKGRPRLSSKLDRSRTTLSVTIGNGNSMVAGDAADNFQNWVTRVRFPNTSSQRLQKRLYVVMCQPHIQHADVVNKITDANIAQLVLHHPVSRPDETVLTEVIQKLNIQQSPFPELTAFIRTCFRAFPQKNARELTLLKYMQLYMAAYQHNDLWKECWKAVYPLLSYQVIKDVEEFVKQNAFNQQAFIDIMHTE